MNKPRCFDDLPIHVQARVLLRLDKNRRQTGLTYFGSQGIAVEDPFMDETGRMSVDPVEYYGDLFLNSAFCVDG